MTETKKRAIKRPPVLDSQGRRTAWPEGRPKPEPVNGKAPREARGGPRGNGTSLKLREKPIRPGINSYSLYKQWELVIAELLKQPSVPKAARKLGVSPSTINKWLETEEFNTRYRHARERVLELSISTVGTYVTDAVETLGRNLRCGRPDSEIRAAAVILSWAGKFIPGADTKAASEKMAEAIRQNGGGTTVIVVDGSEDEYIDGLKEATLP